jgi:IclR family acetate operon transcriptional repressor
MIQKECKYDVPGLRAGIDIFAVLCQSPDGLGVAEISDRSGVNKHMVFRCLKTLVAKGWVSESGDVPKYSATLVPFHFAAMPVARMDIVTAAEEPLRALWKKLGECVYLGIVHEDKLMYLIHRNGMRDVHLGGRVGVHYWMHASAPGKILLAFGDEGLRERCLGHGLEKLTDNTHTDGTAFRAELERVREQGFAVDDEEYTKGGRCFAAPVFDREGKVAASVGTTVLTVHYTLREVIDILGPQILQTARAISTIMGYVP